MKATAKSTIRWLKMINIKDCNKSSECVFMNGIVINRDSTCHCADRLRRLTLTKPLNTQHEKCINKAIETEKKKYELCKKSSDDIL